MRVFRNNVTGWSEDEDGFIWVRFFTFSDLTERRNGYHHARITKSEWETLNTKGMVQL